MNDTGITCPYCGGLVPPDATICPDCQEDLSALIRLEYGHLIPHNQAVALAREGKWKDARDKALVALEMAPDFAPSHALLAKIYAQQGLWPDARVSALRAQELMPQDENASELVATIEESVGESDASRQEQTDMRQRNAEDFFSSYQRDVTGAFVLGLGIAATFAAVANWLGKHRGQGA